MASQHLNLLRQFNRELDGSTDMSQQYTPAQEHLVSAMIPKQAQAFWGLEI
jgi:hypothetical protein